MPYEIPLEGGKVREFALATRSKHPDHHRGADAVLPPTFLTTAQFFWSGGETGFPLDFDVARVLHAEEEFVFHGPPPTAGQTLHVTMREGARYEKQGSRGGTLRFVEIVHEFRDADGVLVAEEKTTLVETAKAPTS